MKKRKFQKGAISIFLVIILIPSMVISSVFVDMSRVVMGKGYATSAADLALNSLMANYDPELSEFYGMVASCQTIDQFYEESAYLFMDALTSQGISAEDTDNIMAYINSLALGTDVHDLFQMEVLTTQGEKEKVVSAVENASLGESAVIIKDSVVEFMKYRGPIEITTKIIERLKNVGAAEVLGKADENEDLIEEKKEYAEKEEDFMDAAYKTYKKVVEYEKERRTNKLDADTMSKMVKDLKAARETYRKVVAIMVSNLNIDSKTPIYKRTVRELDAFTFEAADIASSEKEGTYYIDGDDIVDLLDKLEDEITDFKNARKAISNAVGSDLINATVSATGDDNYHPIQWWKAVVSKFKKSLQKDFDDAADDMLKAYAKVLAMDGCTLGKKGKKLPDDWKETRRSLMQSVTDLQDGYLTAGTFKDKDNMYLKLVNQLEKVSTKYKSKITVAGATLDSGETTTEALKRVQKQIADAEGKLDKCIKLLDTIINGGGWLNKNPYSLNSLGDKAKAYCDAFEDWSDQAGITNTDMGKDDREEIAKMRAGNDKNTAPKITKDDVGDFKTRASNIKSKLESVKKIFTDMKFAGKKLSDIGDKTTAYNLIDDEIGTNLTNKAVKDKGAKVFKDNFTPYSSDTNAEVASVDFSNKDYSPKFTENEPKFHKWMYKHFEVEEDGANKAKNKKKEKEEEAKKAEEDAKTGKGRGANAPKTNLYKNDAYKGEDFPSGLDGNLSYKLGGSILSSLGNTVSSLMSGSIDSIRDALYSTEYVMDMFSYDTYVYEGKYNLGIDNGTYKSAKEAEAAYEKDKYAAVTGEKESDEGTWLSESPFDSYNKSLTNQMINSTNNLLHGAEVEYILYGKENKKNIQSAYGDIFALRLPLNTVSGFQNFWSPNSKGPDGQANPTAIAIHSAATALSGATGGVVPVAIIKVVAITLLAVTETVNDTKRLEKGFQVELYKNDFTQWTCAINKTGLDADTDFSAKGTNNVVCENGLFYSDYLYLFTLLGFQSDSASEMYRRTADLIQVNMRKMTGNNDFKMKNAKTYFQIDATIRVDPLMLAMPLARTYDKNPYGKTDWCTFNINVMRGYS